jgi:hypothetical protein
MSNQAAVKFVKQLVAAFCRYKVEEDTKKIYAEKISFFKLTQEQWDAALGHLMDTRQEEGLPLPSVIIEELQRQQTISTKNKTNLGWLTFRLKGHLHAVRIKSVDSQWLNATVSYKDQYGERHPLQTHPNEPYRLPIGAEEVKITADNPAQIDQVSPPPMEIEEQIQNLANLNEVPF